MSHRDEKPKSCVLQHAGLCALDVRHPTAAQKDCPCLSSPLPSVWVAFKCSLEGERESIKLSHNIGQ